MWPCFETTVALRPMVQLLLVVRCLLDDLRYGLRLRHIDRMAAGSLAPRRARARPPILESLGVNPL